MHISVESTNVDLGDAFRARADTAIKATNNRYFGHLEDANVHVRREGHGYACSVSMHVSTLPRKAAEATNKDCNLALMAALEKVSKQLRRLKRAVREDKPRGSRR